MSISGGQQCLRPSAAVNAAEPCHAVHMLSGATGVTVVATSANFYEGSDGAPPAAAAPPADDDERPLALQLRFQLPPSVYATMAVSYTGLNCVIVLCMCRAAAAVGQMLTTILNAMLVRMPGATACASGVYCEARAHCM